MNKLKNNSKLKYHTSDKLCIRVLFSANEFKCKEKNVKDPMIYKSILDDKPDSWIKV